MKSYSPNESPCRLCKNIYCSRRAHLIKHNNGIRQSGHNNGSYFYKINLFQLLHGKFHGFCYLLFSVIYFMSRHFINIFVVEFN